MHPAIFLDRDGVILENCPGYVRSWAEVSIYPEALAALVRCKDSAYKIVLVTNQSAVGRGIIPLSAAEEINVRLVQAITAAGGRIDAVFMCPHAPAEQCDCRKPHPGLFLQAARSLSLDLHRSIMVGDSLTDLKAAQSAGVLQTARVRTGRGRQQAALPAAAELAPFLTCENLGAALAALL